MVRRVVLMQAKRPGIVIRIGMEARYWYSWTEEG